MKTHAAMAVDFCLDISPYIAALPLFIIFMRMKSLPQRVKVAALAINSIINVLLAAVAKNIIAQPRPESNEYGMPSAHAMFWSGFLLFLILEFPQSRQFGAPAWYIAPLSAFVCWERVSSGHHSESQVIFGIICGLLQGCVGALIMRIGVYDIVVIIINAYDYVVMAIYHRLFHCVR